MLSIKKLIIILSLPFLLANGSIFAGKKEKQGPNKLSKEERAASKEYYAQRKAREAELNKRIQQLESQLQKQNQEFRKLLDEQEEFQNLKKIADKLLHLVNETALISKEEEKAKEQIISVHQKIKREHVLGNTIIEIELKVEQTLNDRGIVTAEEIIVEKISRPVGLLINDKSNPQQIAEDIQLRLLVDLYSMIQSESRAHQGIQSALQLMSSEDLTVKLYGNFIYYYFTYVFNALKSKSFRSAAETLVKELERKVNEYNPIIKKLTIYTTEKLTRIDESSKLKTCEEFLKITTPYCVLLDKNIKSLNSKISDTKTVIQDIQNQKENLKQQLESEKTVTQNAVGVATTNDTLTDDASTITCATDAAAICNEPAHARATTTMEDIFDHTHVLAACATDPIYNIPVYDDRTECSPDYTCDDPAACATDCVYAVPVVCTTDQASPQKHAINKECNKNKSTRTSEKLPAALPVSPAQRAMILVRENRNLIEIESTYAIYFFYKLYPGQHTKMPKQPSANGAPAQFIDTASSRSKFIYDTTPGRPGDYIGKWYDAEKQAQYPAWFENDRTCHALGRQAPHILFKAIPECADLLLESDDIAFNKIYTDHNGKKIETRNMIGCIIPKIKLVDGTLQVTAGLMPRVDCEYTWGYRKQSGQTICYHRCAQGVQHAGDLLEKVRAQNKVETLPAEWDETDFPALASKSI